MAAPPARRPPRTLWHALQIQGRVIYALLMREIITRFGRHNVGVLWLVAEPMLFTLGVTALWSRSGLHDASLSIVAFALTGYSSVLMWRNTVSHCVSALHSNLSLLYHRNVLPIDVLAARILLEWGGATGSFIVLLTFFVGIEWITPPVDPLAVVGGWLMLAWFGGALALAVGAATAYSGLVERLWKPLSYLLFPLSGAGFMVDWLPPAGRDVVLMLPMVHGVELLRKGYFGPAVATHFDIGYMAACNLALLFVGLVLLRGVSRRLEAE